MTVKTEELSIILKKLNKIEENGSKSYLASLTKDSNTLLDTQEVADLLGYSYQHVYREIVSSPDFPKPVNLTNKKQKNEHRRWIAGDVIKYTHKCKAS